ncbi:hypothetical protein L1987_66659 [Smallanthus sonchifolius]|uniref:Uncharacterized protein n=1 Tax=Smallanthus sonchifolius TaxID=185202 RepID=A0ACB9BXV9_9ASTR|nr:hypothetical protein L1987_66659 [Smallanthus sonchifolius]
MSDQWLSQHLDHLSSLGVDRDKVDVSFKTCFTTSVLKQKRREFCFSPSTPCAFQLKIVSICLVLTCVSICLLLLFAAYEF